MSLAFARDGIEGSEQAIDFVGCAVVCQTDTYRAASRFEPEPLHQSQRIVVAAPAVDSLCRKMRGSRARRETLPGEGDGGNALCRT